MIGTSVDRYKIVEELGHGGMSVVYRGVDTTLDRDVAVKVLHEHLAKKVESRRRFHREAKAIARLRHPNILSIYDYSAENSDRSYIVMEYVKGWNLREFQAIHGAPPPEVGALLGIKIADALSNAHDHGIIHRDLKPENIMVSSTGDLKLTDFGIAHVIDAETMTQTGSLLGSPAHMAPEIIEGERVDTRADIFSMGTVLYWLCTGKLPFDGANAPQVLKKVLQGDYEDPEVVDGCVGHHLAAVIRKAMAHNPDERFETIRGLRQALEVIVHDAEIEDVDLELRRYLTHPERYVELFSDGIVGKLEKRGRIAMAQKNLPEAMALFNRVLCYEPDNAEVAKTLDSLGRRAAIPRVAGVLMGALAVAAVGLALYSGAPDVPAGSTPDTAQTNTTARGDMAAEVLTKRLEDVANARASANEQGLILGDTVSAYASLVARSRNPVVRPMLIPPRPRPIEVLAPVPPKEPDMGEEQTFKYHFRVRPAAAQLVIDRKSYSAFQAASGIELTEGTHSLTATSRACKPYRGTVVVDGHQHERMDVVLQWEDGIVKINSEVSAVVYVGASRNIGKRIPAGGSAIFRYKLGDASKNPRRRVSFRVAPTADMKRMQVKSVALIPGATQNIDLSFRASP